ncbi:LCP family protein [Demequina aestuarii]|uniref:LCP family protein n=1 Tax=Demequina aestuarii TaxID=327095 RepID=UPI000781F28A|nr:LCP family protein [Demequina aestuarii]
MPAATRPVRPRHASRAVHRRVLGTLAAASAAILGFAAVGGATYLQLTVGALETHDVSGLLGPGKNSTAEPVEEGPTNFAPGEPINIALIGTDERNGENGEIGGFVTEGMRGDTTMVMHISADRSRIDVVSIPRDSRVRVSDCQMFDGSTVKGWTGKFNIALANGGQNGNRGEAAACVMRTINDLTGVDFSGHFMMVDFSGFQNMVDSLGGIPMCIPQDMYSTKAKLDLEAGPQVLDGETALAYARARTGTGLGDGTDLMRIDRQQELLTNTARQVFGSNLLTDVPELTQFVRSAAESLTVDNELGSLNNIIGLAYSLRNFDTANLTFATVPWQYAGDGSGDVLWREAEAAAMWQSIVDDEPIVIPEDDQESATAEPSPDPSAAGTTSPGPAITPQPTASPVRETQEDILDSCVVPES